MSHKERDRLVMLSQVKAKGMTLIEAAERLSLSYRQAKRLWARYGREGDAGLVHRLRGRPSNAGGRSDPQREAALAAYRAHYAGFRPTLAAQMLAQRHKLEVDHETLRRWLIGAGLWTPRRDRRREHRRRRERKAHAGEMVQMDGSDHDWFEGRGPRCTLMVMVDDATSWLHAQFHPAETTTSAMQTFRGYVGQRGLPRCVYLDKDSAYRVNGAAADAAEDRGDKRPLTQFGRAMAELGVELIHAHSPQAKGRVERCNGTLQDRLVKLLRLEGISEIDAANRYLQQVYLPDHNARFAVAAAQAADLHAPAPPAAELERALCVRETRKVGNDYCVSYRGRWLELIKHDANLGLRGREVTVLEHLDGRLELRARGRTLAHQELAARPAAPPPRVPLTERVAGHKPRRPPPPSHPFRAPIGGAVGRGSAGVGSAPARLADARRACATPTPAEGTVLLSR